MVKPASTFEELLAQREDLIAQHREQLTELDMLIQQAARARNFVWSPLSASGGRVSPGHRDAKQSFHDRNREECLKRGWTKPDGSADLERFRLEKKAQAEGISIIEVAKREAAEKAKRAELKFKGVSKSSKK